MSAKKLLKILEDSGMFEASVLAELKKQVAENKPTAAAVAKALVDKGHLTKFQATKLVGQATEGEPSPPAAAPSASEDDLGLAPLEGDNEESEEAEEDVVMLEAAAEPQPAAEVVGLTPVEDAGAGLTPVGNAELTPVQPETGGSGGDLFAGGADAAPDPFASSTGGGVTLPRKVKASVWDTKLMYLGGGGLVLLLIVGTFLYLNLTATPALELWEQAMEEYRSGSYASAMGRFEDFVDKFPDHENSSEGRVRIMLCQLRNVVRDPGTGLERAQTLLPQAEEEESFRVARDELATILIQIPQGFVRKAKLTDRTEDKEQLATQAEAGMELISNPSYVPGRQRGLIQADIQRVREDINLVRRDINQDKDLRKAITDIKAATENDDTLRAYAIYKELVDEYPALTHDPDLLEVVREVTRREKGLVSLAGEPLAAVTEEVEQSTDNRVVLASRVEEGGTPLEGVVATVLAGGSVYGLDVGKGDVLWSRFVGLGTETHPVRVSDDPDADVLIVDGNRHELVRLRSTSGDLVWRLPIGQPFARPVVAGTQALVSTSGGQVLEVDLESGDAARAVEIPKKLTVGPAVSRTRPTFFQVSDHSNLYVMSSQSLQCRDVFYLGHQEGSIAVPPLVHMGHVFVAENGSDFTLLHVLRIREGETQLETAQQPIRLQGNVVVPLIAYGNSRVLTVTDRGEVRVFDVNMNRSPPVSDAAKLPPTLNEPMTCYPLADATSVWVANDRLTQYSVQLTTKQINRQSLANVGDTFVGPLQMYRDILVHARRLRAGTGITVAAVQIDAPRKSLWEVDLGVPAGDISVDPQDQTIRVISANAAMFKLTGDHVTGGVPVGQAVAAPQRSSGFTHAVPFADGRVALASPVVPDQVLVHDPDGETPLEVVTLDEFPGNPTSLPIAFQGGLLFTSDSGDVLLFDLETGAYLALPFRPRLAPGESIEWLPPAVTQDGQHALVANRRGELFQLEIAAQPRPHLTVVQQQQLEDNLDTQLAVHGDHLFGIQRGAEADQLVAISLDKLETAETTSLDGRVTWGPRQVGDTLLVVVDAARVFAFDGQGKALWKEAAPSYGQPVGPPLADDGHLVFASTGGTVWRLNRASGEVGGQHDLGEPLARGPWAYGDRLLVAGHEGALHILPMVSGS